MKKSRKLHFSMSILAYCFAILLSANVVTANSIPPAEMKTFKTYSRLLLPIDESLTYEWKDTSQGFEIFVKDATLEELGIHRARKEQIFGQIAQISDERLKSLKFDETSSGVKISGTWNFPKGDLAPADPKMERFEFRQKTPPQLVVDFWVKKGPTVAEVRKKQEAEKRKKALNIAHQKAKKREMRRLASVIQRAELEDEKKFCKEALTDGNDIFLEFKPAHAEVDFSRWISTMSPDDGYVYSNPFLAGNAKDDVKYMVLAKKLDQEGKPALVVRTIEFFEKEYPHSRLMIEMQFLKASALFRLGMKEKSVEILKKLVKKSKESPSALHSAMFLAADAFSKKNYLESLEYFLWLSLNQPQHRLRWVFYLGTAESQFYLKQTDRALKNYRWVMKNALTDDEQAEAALRMGDLYMDRGQYAQALASYYRVLKEYGDQAKNFPEVYLNRAEALYWLGEYEQAEVAFEQFLKEFPSYTGGWRATLRLAEIGGRKFNRENKEHYRKWLAETVNRYPFSQGAGIARMRMMQCGDHGGFDFKMADQYYQKEAEVFKKSDDVILKRYADFKILSQIRTFITMGHEKEAIGVMAKELHSPISQSTHLLVTELFKRSFRKSILEMLNEGKKYDALNFYHQYAWIIEKDTSPEFTDYLLRLALAAADLQLVEHSKKLMTTYRTLHRAQEHYRGIASNDGEIETRLRKSEESFLQAKAIWKSSGMNSEEEVRKILSRVADESPQAYQRELILALLEKEKKNYKKVLEHILRAQMLMTKENGDLNNQIDYLMAECHRELGNEKEFLALFQKLQKNKKNSVSDLGIGLPVVPSRGALFSAEAEYYENQKNWGKAAEAYSRAVEGGLDEARILYSYARALRNTGDSSNQYRAEEILKKLANDQKDSFWRKLAQEELR